METRTGKIHFSKEGTALFVTWLVLGKVRVKLLDRKWGSVNLVDDEKSAKKWAKSKLKENTSS